MKCWEPGAKERRHFAGNWPKFISEKEVRRLLGDAWYEHFAKNPKVRVSEWYNFTGRKGYHAPGDERPTKLIPLIPHNGII
jgi:hypothetical protein